MSVSFRIFDMRSRTYGSQRDDLERYLDFIHHRFSNAIHAQTNVYTCRAWSRDAERTQARAPQWGEEITGETRLGAIGWACSRELRNAVEATLGRGEPVWLFVFNSDADLCFEEVLVPCPRLRP